MIWVNIRRKNKPPLIIGTYYGKQESRTSKNEIEFEIQLLTEEIIEMKREGEIIIAMDGNAKIGLIDEAISRNGKLLNQVFNDQDLIVLNKSAKCTGSITRQNTKNKDEVSAIDFVVTTTEAEKWVESVLIDEEGLMKIKGRNETDHNTIQIDLNIPDLDYTKPIKHTTWNLQAPEENWTEFNRQLDKRQLTATQILQSNLPMNEKYRKWFHEIDNAARETIGKTTIKLKKRQRTSNKLKDLRNKKKELQTLIQNENNHEKRKLLIDNYKDLQKQTNEPFTYFLSILMPKKKKNY